MSSPTVRRIKQIAEYNLARSYLEVGVSSGETFLALDFPFKVAVEPSFAFNIYDHQKEGTVYFNDASDVFFESISTQDVKRSNYGANAAQIPDTFDIIFIDGLHTFEQSYRDFLNSLKHAHDKTVWILDDTVPSDPYSAYPDQTLSYKMRHGAGVSGYSWHGDVYKTLIAIHDYHPEFRYATLMEGNPQTVCWMGSHEKRKRVSSSLEALKYFSYFDFLDNAHIVRPLVETSLEDVLGRDYSLVDLSAEELLKIVQYAKLETFSELQHKDSLTELLSALKKS